VQERILAFTDTPDTAFAPTLTHRDVLEFATIDGARACALDHKIGSLKPGKQADIVMIRTDQVNVAPVIDPVATVVICADTSNIDTVFVAGRIVKRNGALVRLDLPRLLDRLGNARDHLLSHAGVIPKWTLSRRD
jgi:cytosine/adenosine deaminase-related metal-dependent hydrolase